MSNIGDAIRSLEGFTPRIVAQLRSFDYDLEFVRDDVADRYSVEDFDEAYQLIMANQITGDDFRELIGRGAYNAQTLFFDDIIVFLFSSNRYEAMFASFDYEEDFPVTTLVSRVSECREETEGDG
ncbi:hypothetical protein [Salinigranum sp.]|uniref:hypothetical protein n=1 Tax=Salinigranum sp. TaxID=1966351 RepID=UPI0035630C22